jgi:branched-chain amino acid transport system ATP-binding protein
MGDPKRPIIAGRFWLPGMNLAAGGKTGLAYGWALRLPEGRRVFPYMSVRDNLTMGAFSRSETASVRASFDDVLARFPRLKDRLRQAASTMSGGEQQMLVIGRALMAKPWLLLLDEPSLGVATKIVQDIARSIVAINRDEKVSVLLVEQNSRMALRISNRAMR